jgi:hypothetical protein
MVYSMPITIYMKLIYLGNHCQKETVKPDNNRRWIKKEVKQNLLFNLLIFNGA